MNFTIAPSLAAATAWLAPLPPGVHKKIATDDCLTWFWQMFGLDNHIGIGTTYNENI
jgi:hypothetical protein